MGSPKVINLYVEVEQTETDTLLFNIQKKIYNAFMQSLNLKDNSSLSELNEKLKDSKSGKKNLILYWRAYLQFYSTIYYLEEGNSEKAEKEIDKGIDLVEKIKKKNSEDYALLAMLQGFSIQFKGMKAMFIGPRSLKNGKYSLRLDSLNLRAYYVLAVNDFYTPEQFGGGQKTEKYLMKAISLPNPNKKNSYFPSWGKEEAYELLIRFYMRKKEWTLALQYFHEGIRTFPDSHIINLLASELYSKTEQNIYPFEIDITGKGDPIILIPGLTCPGEVWDETIKNLQAQYECHTLSLVGFSNRKPFDLNNGYLPVMQNKISEYIKNELDKKPIIMGHSLGGFLALSVATVKPDLVESIILVDSYPFLSLVFNPEASESNSINQANQMKNYTISSADSVYRNQQKLSLKTMITDSLKIEKALKWSIDSDRRIVAQAMYEMMTTDLRDELSYVKNPILVLGSWYGYKDYGATKEGVTENLQNQFINAENCTIKVAEKAKHFIMWDNPDWFIKEVKTFLDGK
jgi:pimeloyl-ACP methyl ester carboxylesterase